MDNAACPTLGNIELSVGFFSPLGAEVVVGGRVVAHQTVNEAWRGNFVRFVGWAAVRERFTMGHSRDRMLVVFSVAGGVRRRPAVGAGSRAER